MAASGNTKGSFITVRATAEEKKQIKSLAEKCRMSMTDYVIYACLNYVSKDDDGTERILRAINNIENMLKSGATATVTWVNESKTDNSEQELDSEEDSDEMS